MAAKNATTVGVSVPHGVQAAATVNAVLPGLPVGGAAGNAAFARGLFLKGMKGTLYKRPTNRKHFKEQSTIKYVDLIVIMLMQ